MMEITPLRDLRPEPAACTAAGARALSALLSLCLLLTGCSSVQRVKELVAGPPSPFLSGYIGEVAADEPRAALVGRDVLARGGNAADAAAAIGLALAVTLPSRASLGAGGACLAFDASKQTPPEAILFMPVAGGGTPGDRPGAIPMLARGLYLLQTRHGSVDFDELVHPAEELARNGITVSRAFASDLSQVSAPLLADPGMRSLFGETVPAVNDRLVQPELALTLQRLSSQGVGDLYDGALADEFVQGADQAGAGIDAQVMRHAVPRAAAALELSRGHVDVAFLPPPADGGLAAAAAFRAIGAASPQAASEAEVSAWRAAYPGDGGDETVAAQAFLDAPAQGGSSLGDLPASTSFVVLDRSGNAVSCALTMDNLFGTGRVAGGTGIIIGASPARFPRPLLAAAIAWSRGEHAFRAAVAASGQRDAAAAAAEALHAALGGDGTLSRGFTQSGRANVISCPRGLPGDSASCVGATDRRAAGLAIGSD